MSSDQANGNLVETHFEVAEKYPQEAVYCGLAMQAGLAVCLETRLVGPA